MLSKRALALFRKHLEQCRTIDGETNREAYRELAKAGLMIVGNTFAGRKRKRVSRDQGGIRAEGRTPGLCERSGVITLPSLGSVVAPPR